MEVESVLVTGANRGIGLEFVKQLVKLPKPPHFVFATYREETSAEALKEIRDASKESRVVLIPLDITKKEDIVSARKMVESYLGDKGLNLLINNAGRFQSTGFFDITEEDMVSHFATNTVGPVIVLKEFLSLLQKSVADKDSGMNIKSAVLNISSGGGSIGYLTEKSPRQFWDILGYRTSKAALNMAMRVAAFKIKDQGVLVVNMCPGWVRTDMGGENAWLSPEESISDMLKTLAQLNESHHGEFLDRNGKTIPF